MGIVMSVYKSETRGYPAASAIYCDIKMMSLFAIQSAKKDSFSNAPGDRAEVDLVI